VTSEQVLDRLAEELNSVCRTATLDLSFKIGRLIVDTLYEGNIRVWAKDGARRSSYRKLAARGDLLVSPSALCRAVGVYVLCERFGGSNRWKHLSSSHLQELLPLDEASQDRLLLRAEQERWTVSQLRSEVEKLRNRKPLLSSLRMRRATRALSNLLEKHRETFSTVATEALDEKSVDCLCNAVSVLQLQLEVLREVLARYKQLSRQQG
jgi:hypothetical protein